MPRSPSQRHSLSLLRSRLTDALYSYYHDRLVQEATVGTPSVGSWLSIEPSANAFLVEAVATPENLHRRLAELFGANGTSPISHVKLGWLTWYQWLVKLVSCMSTSLNCPPNPPQREAKTSLQTPTTFMAPDVFPEARYHTLLEHIEHEQTHEHTADDDADLACPSDWLIMHSNVLLESVTVLVGLEEYASGLRYEEGVAA